MEIINKSHFENSLSQIQTISPININIIKDISNTHNAIQRTISVVTYNPITFSKSLDFNKAENYVERKEIDMVQLKIDKIITRYRNFHIFFFIVSVLLILISWNGLLIDNETSVVLKPLSIGFSLMIIMNYFLRRVK